MALNIQINIADKKEFKAALQCMSDDKLNETFQLVQNEARKRRTRKRYEFIKKKKTRKKKNKSQKRIVIGIPLDLIVTGLVGMKIGEYYGSKETLNKKE